GRPDDGLPMLEDAASTLRVLGDAAGLAAALNTVAYARQAHGEYRTATAALEESLALSRALGNAPGAASALFYLGLVAVAGGDPGLAHARFAEATTIAR